jgi:photosystem II stability/assembly factor-like uncharacterized protein
MSIRKTSARAWAWLAVLCAVLAGCGQAVGHPPAGQGPSAASHSPGSHPAPGTSPSSPAAAPAPGQPAGGPVPRGFAAASVTFVSLNDAFVLGTAPCQHAPCTSILRTRDRGRSWRGIPAPVAPLGWPGDRHAVWGIRFASPTHGFVFGDGLWETTNGGATWRHKTIPKGIILSLATIGGQVLALTEPCASGARCSRQPAALVRRPLDGRSWHLAAQIHMAAYALDPTSLIATRAGVAAVIDGTSVLVSGDGGKTWARHAGPCAANPFPAPASVALTGTDGLALLCTGQGYTGHTGKVVYSSGDGGAHWTRQGTPASAGDGGTLAASSPGHLVISTESAASWLYYSTDQGATWQVQVTKLDGGAGWADLGFTSGTDGVVVYAPARTDGNPRPHQGRLLLTHDAGATWQRVSY